ncbi:hypothetical protein [Morganella morganii]|uniref:hypothetical protein n=1 Tax=Morganella morganii TaxID=582 RepID=UPI0030FE2775
MYLLEGISTIVGGSVYSQTTQNARRNDGDDFFSQGSLAGSEKSQRPFMLTPMTCLLLVGVLMARCYDRDSLTYEDLAEKAHVRGTATTRVRIKYQENTETGRRM